MTEPERMSEKQAEYWSGAVRRWNIKYGATRSGKTYLDYYMIPRRISERRGKEGLILLIGNTRQTLARNVVEPMRAIYPDDISAIGYDGTCTMFGEKVWCMGADTRSAVDRLRGASLKYCYGDEVVSWDSEVFEMLKSRLDKPWSCFDGTCNPEGPEHWFKQFLDSGADIFAQRYTLDDNPFLDEGVKNAIKAEYSGVFYERYVLGRWVLAEGLVFPQLAREPERWTGVFPGQPDMVNIGIDFGGYRSRTCMTAVALYDRFRLIGVTAHRSLPVKEELDAETISAEFVRFAHDVRRASGRLDHAFGDSASPTMIATCASAARREGLSRRLVSPCRKTPVTERPVMLDRLLGAGLILFAPDCADVMKALGQLRWDPASPDRPEDRNAGSINDVYDSLCYGLLTYAEKINRR